MRRAAALLALALVAAACSTRPADGNAGSGPSSRSGRTVSRFEVDETATLSGQPGGIGLDRDGSAVELDDNTVVAFDEHGHLRWSTPVAGAALGWPWLGHGVVVVPTLSMTGIYTGVTNDGGCTALDRATGARRWSYTEGHRSGVAVSGLDDRAYCVFGDGTIVAIDIDSGDLVWRVDLDPSARAGSLEVSERTAVVVDPSSERLVVTVRDGDKWLVAARGLAHGEDRGALELSPYSPPSAPVLIGPGRVAVADDGRLCMWDLRRLSLSRVKISSPEGFDPASIPVLADGAVIVVASEGTVSAVDVEHHTVRWTTRVDTTFLDVRPVVSDDLVLVADSERDSWALRVADGSRGKVPAVDGYAISAAPDPRGGVAVAVRGEDRGTIQHWRPAA